MRPVFKPDGFNVSDVSVSSIKTAISINFSSRKWITWHNEQDRQAFPFRFKPLPRKLLARENSRNICKSVHVLQLSQWPNSHFWQIWTTISIISPHYIKLIYTGCENWIGNDNLSQNVLFEQMSNKHQKETWRIMQIFMVTIKSAAKTSIKLAFCNKCTKSVVPNGSLLLKWWSCWRYFFKCMKTTILTVHYQTAVHNKRRWCTEKRLPWNFKIKV